MTTDKTRELLQDLYDLFYFGYPVYPDSQLSDSEETFKERVEELLRLQKEKQ